MARDLEEIFESIDSKLNTLIILFIINSPQTTSLKEKIRIFSQAGMSNKEISKILGISPVHVAKERSLIKKNG